MVQHREICDMDLEMYFLVPFECIVCFLLVYYSKVIKSAELFICTKQIICGYLGFELFVFLVFVFFLLMLSHQGCCYSDAFHRLSCEPIWHQISCSSSAHFLCSPPFFQKEVCFLLVQFCFSPWSRLKNCRWEFQTQCRAHCSLSASIGCSTDWIRDTNHICGVKSS